jgi:putative intracellular protease/amidase
MQIAIALYDDFTGLDAMGPYEILARIPGATFTFVAERAGIVTSDTGALRVEVANTFADVPRPDVLLVPGGPTTGQLIADHHPVIEWVRQAHPSTLYTTSVCTGALLLGAAGVLDGLRATTHWGAAGSLANFGATYESSRVVEQGKVITAAGVSAGIDMALTLAARLKDETFARAVQLAIEYDPKPPFACGSPSMASPEVMANLGAIFGAKQSAA